MFLVRLKISKKKVCFENIFLKPEHWHTQTFILSILLFHEIFFDRKRCCCYSSSAFTRQSTFMTIIIPSIVSATDIHVSPWINKKERIRSIYKYLFQPRYRLERKIKKGKIKRNWNILYNNDKQKNDYRKSTQSDIKCNSKFHIGA